MLPWPTVVVAASSVLAIASLGCAIALLRCRARFAVGGVPTGVSTLVSGTLSGLALLVMLPSALEEAKLHGKTTTSVMLTFMGAPLGMFYPYSRPHPHPHQTVTCTHNHTHTSPAPLISKSPFPSPGMFFIHHILFEHNHHHPQPIDSQQQASSSTEGDVMVGGGDSGGGAATPAPRWWKQRAPGCARARCQECSGPGRPASPTDQPASPKKPLAVDSMVLMNICEEVPPESRRPSADDQPPPTPEELVLVFVRATAWFVHSVLDGAMLGAAQSLPILFATAIPVIVCAVQDVASLVVSDAARRQTNGQTVLTSIVFAMGFPVGTALVACMPTWTETELALPLLRAAVAGIFFYMAIFELAPPHAHGRWASLLQLAAFMLGVSMAYIAELAEDAIIEAANGHLPDASVATKLRGTQLAPSEHAAAAVAAAASRTGGKLHDGWHANTARAAIQDVPGGNVLTASSL